MRVTTYCFLYDIKFDPIPKPFNVKDGVAWIGNEYEPNTGQPKQEIVGCFLSYETAANIDDFLQRTEDPKDYKHEAYFKKVGELLDKHRGELNEVATLIEGLISMASAKPFPAFFIEHVQVRLNAESEEEQRLIDEGKVHHTFGDIGKSHDKSIGVVEQADEIFKDSAKAAERLSALSIYTLAARAQERFELEIAYTNFFRIIEGYFGDGSSRLEDSLLARADEIMELVKPDDVFLKGLKSILSHLSLPSKATSVTDNKNIVSDLVLLRHKLAHYNLTNQDRHFYSSMRVDLKAVNHSLHYAALMLLRKDLSSKKT